MYITLYVTKPFGQKTWFDLSRKYFLADAMMDARFVSLKKQMKIRSMGFDTIFEKDCYFTEFDHRPPHLGMYDPQPLDFEAVDSSSPCASAISVSRSDWLN